MGWHGLDTGRRGPKLERPDAPNLQPKGEHLPGRWTFLSAEPWRGAPYYADGTGRKVVAVVRLNVPQEKLNSPATVTRLAADTLRHLGDLPPVTGDERRFRTHGLVIVFLPGSTLVGQQYAQFRRDAVAGVTLPGGLERRVAFLDDLDLPVPPDRRLRALLEVALPRFPDALSSTFQNADPVRPYMFFGRGDELARLTSATAVVYSGRRMGKSSLLHRLRNECRGTDRRAVYVGCTVSVRRRDALRDGVRWRLSP